MPKMHQPKPISKTENRARIRRAKAIVDFLGFVGSLDYQHVYSQSGGAQYCIGPSADDDIIVLYAEAFERDADPKDFDLDAIIAHECGHQLLLRDKNLRNILANLPGDHLEEVLASLVGSILLSESDSAKTLVWKATADLGDMGIGGESAVQFIERLRRLLRYFI